MKAKFSLRSLFVLAAVVAVVLVLMRGPDLSVEYHRDVSTWSAEQANGVTEWRQEHWSRSDAPIVYSDRDGDGRIDSRLEQKHEYLVLSRDTDSDGMFDEELVQQLARNTFYAADIRPIDHPVPATKPDGR